MPLPFHYINTMPVWSHLLAWLYYQHTDGCWISLFSPGFAPELCIYQSLPPRYLNKTQNQHMSKSEVTVFPPTHNALCYYLSCEQHHSPCTAQPRNLEFIHDSLCVLVSKSAFLAILPPSHDLVSTSLSPSCGQVLITSCMDYCNWPCLQSFLHIWESHHVNSLFEIFKVTPMIIFISPLSLYHFSTWNPTPT